jgi:hypothetical protein
VTLVTGPLFTGEATHDWLTWTPDGSPATIDSGANYKAFPGVARLTATKLLLVYYSGTAHDANGVVTGRIGTLTGTSVSWGSPWDIYDHAEDVRCEDAVSVIGSTVVIMARLYNGLVNHVPFILVCDDVSPILSSSSTWTQVDIAFSEGADENLGIGRVMRLRNGTYLIAATAWTSGTSTAGVLISDDLMDWTAPTWVPIGSSGSLSEICVDELADGSLLATLRRETGTQTYQATSQDHGATWTTPAAAHDGYGLPMFRALTDRTLLTVGRDPATSDMEWRVSQTHGVTWENESILDTTGTLGVYASLVQLDHDNVLCVYGVEVSASDADLYSQVFTRT